MREEGVVAPPCATCTIVPLPPARMEDNGMEVREEIRLLTFAFPCHGRTQALAGVEKVGVQ
jgi:hypothetical protein